MMNNKITILSPLRWRGLGRGVVFGLRKKSGKINILPKLLRNDKLAVIANVSEAIQFTLTRIYKIVTNIYRQDYVRSTPHCLSHRSQYTSALPHSLLARSPRSQSFAYCTYVHLAQSARYPDSFYYVRPQIRSPARGEGI